MVWKENGTFEIKSNREGNFLEKKPIFSKWPQMLLKFWKLTIHSKIIRETAIVSNLPSSERMIL